VFGSAMAIVLLGEKLQPFHLIGYALVLAGVVDRVAPGRGGEVIPQAETERQSRAFRFQRGDARFPANEK